MSTPIHPFAKYVAILGRGKTKQRHLTIDEAKDSMAMILRGETEPEQIGAYLMLLRLKEESPGEIAGFTLGTRLVLGRPSSIPQVDLDWSSYAGKRRQLPWFLLSAILLAQNGVRVMMHGSGEHTPGRIYTDTALGFLGFPVAASLNEAAAQIENTGFAYIGLKDMCPPLQKLMELKPILGLRSPVHSFARMINPFDAPVMMQGIFHRGFMDIHAGAGLLLDQPVTVVFRGEGGEVERRPNKPTMAGTASNGEFTEEIWPQLLPDGHAAADTEMDLGLMISVWSEDVQNDYATASVIGTLAIALRSLGKADSVDSAQALAQEMWDTRDKQLLPLKA